MIHLYIKYLLLFAAIGFAYPATAQLRFGPSEKLPETINSQLEESYPLLSPDGRTLFFTRFNPFSTSGRLSGSDIWASKKNDDGEWQEAYAMPKSVNNNRHNVAIGFDKIGDHLYLLNSYFSTQRTDVVRTSLAALDQRPSLADIPKINTSDGFLGLYVHPSEEIILISMAGEDSFGEEDLYVMLRDTTGRWSKPQNLGPMINTSGFEISPFLSNDGKTLYFSSNGHGGFGDADIFVAHRLYDTWNVWTRPQNLGKNVNSEGFDAYFTITDNQQAFFVSNREGRFADIFMTRVAADQADSTAVKIQQLIEDAQRLLDNPGGGN
jgi:OmpA-OmpF porin, OOP family